jgi:hypothetical protein
MEEYTVTYIIQDILFSSHKETKEIIVEAEDRTDLLNKLEEKHIYDYQIGCIIKTRKWVIPEDYNEYKYKK